ncbi:ArsR family transcriptional regulator [Streptomyces minutiscleroticus]|uniref:ArsR family transcriptional regulator n=1 Tax=Streptomyces minutiscleroticus TaxID=68238 RepID=A0A918NKJ8_9ACTN|nr:ArsR family transcriptional regulator [Streptomyces minutiscleroticus]GGX75305.1 hypothetical protein GCM10010358_31940 [Streptomyces minutiscleroticus]
MMRMPTGELRHDLLERLRDPAAHFAPRPPGDLTRDGVSAESVAAGLDVPVRVAVAHLDLLAAVGLLRTTEVGGLTYYRRDEQRIAAVRRTFERGW